MALTEARPLDGRPDKHRPGRVTARRLRHVDGSRVYQTALRLAGLDGVASWVSDWSMRVRLPCCGPSFRGRAARGDVPRGRSGGGEGVTEGHRGSRIDRGMSTSAIGCVVLLSWWFLSRPGAGRGTVCIRRECLDPFADRQAESPRDRLVGVIPSALGARKPALPAGQRWLGACAPPEPTTKEASFPRPHSRTEIACRMSALPAHESQQPAQSRPTEPRSRGFEVVVVQTKTSCFLMGTVLRPPAAFCFRRGHVSVHGRSPHPYHLGENKAGDADNPNGQAAGWRQTARRNRSRVSGVCSSR